MGYFLKIFLLDSRPFDRNYLFDKNMHQALLCYDEMKGFVVEMKHEIKL